jgi:hypothetical protein
VRWVGMGVYKMLVMLHLWRVTMTSPEDWRRASEPRSRSDAGNYAKVAESSPVDDGDRWN